MEGEEFNNFGIEFFSVVDDDDGDRGDYNYDYDEYDDLGALEYNNSKVYEVYVGGKVCGKIDSYL